ncbi:MAG: hypothetical protein QM791_13815 [Ferruginibacter sp.]
MKARTTSSARMLVRSIAMGVLLSMAFFYSIHVLGKWEVENYRPDPETTSSILLHNTCAVFGNAHTLRPNTDIPLMEEGINGMKLAASFMNFFDGHIIAMIITALLTGTIIFTLWSKMTKAKVVV